MTDQWQQPDPRQQPYQPQYPPQQGYPPPFQPYQPPRRRGPFRWLGFGCLGLAGLVVVIIAIGATHSSSSSSLPAAQPTVPAATFAQQAAPASTAAKAAAKPVTVATFTGSGAQKTATFTVTGTWRLDYHFDCTSFGFKGNFIVLTDGGSDFNGVQVNDIGMTKTAYTYAYNDPGTHYLEVNSECSWAMRVTSMG